MTTTLVLTRGIPGSGKTTWARQWLAEGDGDGNARARLNRDDLRASMFGGVGVLDYAGEVFITRVQHQTARDMLTSGVSVVVDDMNLRAKYATTWANLAREVGSTLVVQSFTDVPLGECIARDAARGARGERAVGEAVIRDIHARYLASGRLAEVTASPTADPAAVEQYTAPDDAPPAWIVDVDGTLALMIEGGRGPYDWHRVGEDGPNYPVLEMVEGLCLAGNNIIVMSGRDESCRASTEEWLARHNVPYHELHMRPEGDTRKDSVVKGELFDKHVRSAYDVRGVIDDRQQVVDFWRSMGLMCAQVAPGDF